MKLRLLFIALLTATVASLQAAGSPDVGTAAPSFSLKDSNGRGHSLSDFKGKYVVLEWFNPGCPFVKKHYESGNMQKLQQAYTDKKVVWLTIDSSAPGKQGHLTPEEAQKQLAAWNMHPTALLLDADGMVGREYGATNTPNMFVISPDGKLIYKGAIDNKPSADQADIAGATNYVKVALDESMAGKPVATATTRPYGCGVKYDR
jgi:peroxiredoxin